MSYNPGTIFRLSLSSTEHTTSILLNNGQILQVKPKHNETFASLEDWRKFHNIGDDTELSVDTSKSRGQCFSTVDNINYPSWSKDGAYNGVKWIYRMVYEFARDLLLNTEFQQAYNDFVNLCKKYEKYFISYTPSNFKLYDPSQITKNTRCMGYMGHFKNANYKYLDVRVFRPEIEESFKKLVSFIPESMIKSMNERYEVDKKRQLLSTYKRMKKCTEKKMKHLNELLKTCDDNIQKLSAELQDVL
jgi:hypothetical protein